MKLLELTRLYYPSIGGMEKFIYDRTKIYERLGIQYTIISTTLQISHQDSSVSVKNVAYLRQLTPYNIVPKLPLYLSDEYDIVSVNSIGRFYSDYAVYHYAKRRQIVILTPYYAFHSDKYSFLKNIFEKYFFPKLLNRVNAIVVFTHIEKIHWINNYRVNPEKIFVIPPFVSLEGEQEAHPSSTEKYLLYLGRRELNKKTDLLLQVFLENPEIDLALKMTLRLQDVSENLRSRAANDKRIQLLGFVAEKEKAKLLAQCDALVFPTSWESFGYVAFEGSMFKKPLLCSDIPVLKELLHPNGVLFFKNTVEELAGTISKFAVLPDEKKKEMGELNYQNLKKFSFDAACLQYQHMFKAVSNLQF